MDIPVFHDDQHGTAIVAAAGLINACHLTGRELRDTKLVVNGAGAAAIACVELLKAMGMRPEHVILCDTKGVVYQGRTEGMNQWKSAHAAHDQGAHADRGAGRRRRVLRPVGEGRADARTWCARWRTSRSSSRWPIPIPEITPEEARAVSPHAIIATGRSDYPNQVNNVLGFPYIFRGALDVRASTINEAMKIAAAEALANLAREDVPDEVHTASTGRRLTFGPEYIIPNAFDPRLISRVPPAVAQGGDGQRRRAPAARRSAALRARAVGPAGSDRGRARRDHGERARQSQARGVRRGRGRKVGARRGGVPQRRLWHAGPDRARGPGARRRWPSLGLGVAGRHRDPQRAAVRTRTANMSNCSTSGCSGAASCSATASAWSTRIATCSPPAWWRPATPTRW